MITKLMKECTEGGVKQKSLSDFTLALILKTILLRPAIINTNTHSDFRLPDAIALFHRRTSRCMTSIKVVPRAVTTFWNHNIGRSTPFRVHVCEIVCTDFIHTRTCLVSDFQKSTALTERTHHIVLN